MAKRTKKPAPDDDFDKVLASMAKLEKDKKILNPQAIQEIRKSFKSTCEEQKKVVTKMMRERQKPCSTKTRAGAKREASKHVVYVDSQYVNKGIDDSQERFMADELSYIERNIQRVKQVRDLDFPHLKYLVVDRFFEELEKIKSGEQKSTFHDRYCRRKGASTQEILMDLKTSLFTNEQRDYINGLLIGAFKVNELDAKGDITYNDIKYVEIVMLFEVTSRIVKFVHKFKTDEETLNFIVQKFREGLGLEEDE